MSGSTISSDSWKGYGRIDQELPDYDFEEHKVVNHSRKFVDLIDKEAHTQNMEVFWSSFKGRMRKKSLSSLNINTIETHFGEFQCKRTHEYNYFEKMLERLSEFFLN